MEALIDTPKPTDFSLWLFLLAWQRQTIFEHTQTQTRYPRKVHRVIVMKRLASLLLSAIAAIWIAVIAIVSVQNYTPVTLRFFTYQSIQVPLGLVLAFSISFGVLGAALLVPLTGQAGSQDDDPL